MKSYFADAAWLPEGWRAQVRFDSDATGGLAAVCAEARPEGAERLGCFVLPGMPNLHSHAFQRVMAGMAERQGDPADSFWTWREQMYAFASVIEPDDLHAIAAQLYVEMLEAGYTQVCEFHYLHHAPDGRRYATRSAMAQALLAAADEVGIGITLLPVLYQTGGFDGRPLSARQRRFECGTDEYLRLCDELSVQLCAGQRLGHCFHSLRAVPAASMAEVLAARAPGTPLHIHIAEQTAEVDECVGLRGQRPVAWLLAHAAVDADWTLVHATHLDADEIAGIARSGAVVGLCPTTEANLGDGLFPLSEFQRQGGRWGIGSDSHISVSPVEELRWLEYGQRLITRRRNIAALPQRPSTGEALLASALQGGAQASGLSIGRLDGATPGAAAHRADFVVLDEQAAPLAGAREANLIDRWIFAGNRPLVRAVYTSGRLRVEDGHHLASETVATRYRQAVSSLQARMG